MKIPDVSASLNESKLIAALLRTLGMSPDMILKTMKFLLDDPPIAETNFDEID